MHQSIEDFQPILLRWWNSISFSWQVCNDSFLSRVHSFATCFGIAYIILNMHSLVTPNEYGFVGWEYEHSLVQSPNSEHKSQMFVLAVYMESELSLTCMLRQAPRMGMSTAHPVMVSLSGLYKEERTISMNPLWLSTFLWAGMQMTEHFYALINLPILWFIPSSSLIAVNEWAITNLWSLFTVHR